MTTCAPSTSRLRRSRLVAVAMSLTALTLAAGCGVIRPLITPSPQPNYYSLAYTPAAKAHDSATPAASRTAIAATTLIVLPPHAAAGFDSKHIMYLRTADQLEYFAYNEWIDTPARMLAPLIVTAVGAGGAFRAVVQMPSPAAGEIRLDTEILRLQHEFLGTPGRVRFTLRANLIESATRRVIASREFEAAVSAASEDPHGGVIAANRAVQIVLEGLADFCAEAARNTPTEK